jgi:hypothetical protein
MQIKILSGLLFAIVIASCYGMTGKKKTDKKMEIKSKVALIELFTSEGCSSCPPADDLIGKTDSENKEVYVLSYHVDYWDRLGWKDPFSQAAFTKRQQEYAQQFDLQSTYTPQVVVNGTAEFVGSDAKRLSTAISQSDLEGLGVTISRRNQSILILTLDKSVNASAQLQVALVQPKATTVVKRGENRGRTLHHVNVVQQLITIGSAQKGSTEIRIPAALQAVSFKAIVFLQEKKDMHITAVTSAEIGAL